MNNDEQKEILTEMFQKAKVKIFIKDRENLLANAQVIVADTLEINGVTIWKSKYPDNPINVTPPTYDPFHKCKAIWIKDEKIWRDLCLKIEREYQNKKEALETEAAIETSGF